MNNQPVTKVNPIRLDGVTSLLENCEVPQIRLLAVNECKPVGREANDNNGCPGRHRVVGDGMVGRCHETTWETPAKVVTCRGVRAAIVAVKRSNSRGAKGGREMDVV
jgi:hypothetical protein